MWRLYLTALTRAADGDDFDDDNNVFHAYTGYIWSLSNCKLNVVLPLNDRGSVGKEQAFKVLLQEWSTESIK